MSKLNNTNLSKQMFEKEVQETNKIKKKPSNILFRDINEFNVKLILIVGAIFIILSGYTSYALFSDTITSNNIISLKVSKKNYEKSFSYTGACEEYTVPYNGYYKVEAWGAQGGYSLCDGSKCSSEPGKGGYTSGIIKLLKGETLYVCVGGKGSDGALQVNSAGGYNGGGLGTWDNSDDETSGGGGGATDIRLVSGAWNNATGLNSRIMVAAGGGGASWTFKGGSGGGLIGRTTYSSNSVGTQTSGSAFGKGADATGTGNSDGVGGGGSGYYGGYAPNVSGKSSGTGGSSFISGYAGVNTITSSTDRTHTNDTLHYSNKYFVDGEMQVGINSGNGKAKITYVSSIKPERVNLSLNNVRYIKDCTNGNSVNESNHWVELQAVYNGGNVAKNKTILTTSDIKTGTAGSPITAIVEGDISYGNWTDFPDGNQCITVDLGQTYDLDEIAVWHYWKDGRTYYDNYTYVSSNNTDWIKVIDKQEPETSEGKRVSAYKNDFYKIIKNQVQTMNISYKYINGANQTINGITYNVNDNGVFLFNGTDDNEGDYPIYYYRGNVTNNNVIFGGFCWKIVRTTSTGGTKLIYNGVPSEDGKCNNTGTASQLSSTSIFNSNYTSPADVGYMYGTRYTYSAKNMSSITDTYKYGNDVTYSNGTYTLTGKTMNSSSWSTDRTTLADGYHYTCFNSTGTCTSVYYITYFGNSSTMYYLTFTGGDNLESAKTKMHTNTNDSTINTAIDNWYSTNLTDYTNYLENTIFCNDRTDATTTTYKGPLASKDTNSTSYSHFKSYENTGKGTPSLQCTNINDRFSLKVESGGTTGYGNNKLTYPVGLLTLDEVVLAGGQYTSNSNYYLYTGKYYWLLSPARWYDSSSNVGLVFSNGYAGWGDVNNGNGVRPAVSLASGTEFEEGTDGTVNNPYVVKTS